MCSYVMINETKDEVGIRGGVLQLEWPKSAKHDVWGALGASAHENGA